MPVPSAITDLSTTAGSNSPAGTDPIGTDADNYLRAHAAFIAALRDGSKNLEAGTATAPSMAFTGDSNTGIYSPTADAIGFAAGGVARYLVNATRQYIGGAGDVYAAGFPYNATRMASGQCFFMGSTDSATPDLVFSNAAGSEVWRMTNARHLVNSANTQPSFHASRETVQTSGTTILFATEDHDYGSNYDTGTGIFTAPVAGVYLFCASVIAENVTGSTVDVRFVISIGGTTSIAFADVSIPNSTSRSASFSSVIKLAANDQISVISSVSFSANFSVRNGPYSRFSGRLLG